MDAEKKEVIAFKSDLNRVEAGFVPEPQHYALSSAIDYAGGKGLTDVSLAR